MKSFSFSSFISAVLTPILVISPLYAQIPAPSASSPSDAIIQTLELHAVQSDGSGVPAGSSASKGFAVQVTDTAGASVGEAVVVFRLPDSGPTGTFADGSHSAVAYTDMNGRAEVSGIQWGETPGSAAIRVTATKGTSHAGILIEQTITTRETEAASNTAPPSPIASPARPQPQAPGTPMSATKVIVPPQQDLSAHAPSAPGSQAQQEPSVSVTKPPPGAATHSGSKAKWYILAAVAAGAGIGLAMAGKGKSSSSSTPTSTLSIGSPSISIGHP